MMLSRTIQNRTEVQEGYAISVLRKKCEHYIAARYTNMAETLADDIKVLLAGLRLEEGYDPLIASLKELRKSRIEKRKTKIFQKDERSLSKIVDNALHHYHLYKLNSRKEEKMSYLSEMGILKQNLAIFNTKKEQYRKRDLVKCITFLLEKYDPSNYSKAQINSLAFAVEQLENPDINISTLKYCVDRLRKVYRK
jgi:hypothetical protein